MKDQIVNYASLFELIFAVNFAQQTDTDQWRFQRQVYAASKTLVAV